MGKSKVTTPKSQKYPHLRARVDFLHRASSLLVNNSVRKNHAARLTAPICLDEEKLIENGQIVSQGSSGEIPAIDTEATTPPQSSSTLRGTESSLLPNEASQKSLRSQLRKPGLATIFVSDLRLVAMRAQIRLSPGIKHSICKRCNTFLLEGHTSRIRVENTSRNASKPWAECRITECLVCGAVKRMPTRTPRQPKRKDRAVNKIQSQICI